MKKAMSHDSFLRAVKKMVGTIRMVMGVDVLPGNQTAGCYSHPGLWRIFDYLPRHLWPTFVRGDIGYGNEGTMAGCEERGIGYLFRLRQSQKVKALCKNLQGPGISWVDAGSGWQGYETELKLSGWSAPRRVVVLRRRKTKTPPVTEPLHLGTQDEFEFVDESTSAQYDWSVPVTNLDYDLRALGQLYRDRGDCENVIGCLAKTGGKKLIHLSTAGRDARKAGLVFKKIAEFVTRVLTATQLNPAQKWICVLNQDFKKYRLGRHLLPTAEGNQ